MSLTICKCCSGAAEHERCVHIKAGTITGPGIDVDNGQEEQQGVSCQFQLLELFVLS